MKGFEILVLGQSKGGVKYGIWLQVSRPTARDVPPGPPPPFVDSAESSQELCFHHTYRLEARPTGYVGAPSIKPR